MECFSVYADDVEGRIDPHFYRPEHVEFYEQLGKTKFEFKTIGEIAETVTSGATPLSKGDAYTSNEEGIPFIRSGDINEDKNINFGDTLYIEHKIHNKQLKGSKLKKGDVLIAIVGATIGQVSIYDYDKEANINQAIALVRLKKGINPEYVKAFMISSFGQKQLDRIKRPVARANINLDEIRGINIILPPLEIQNKIVSLMDNAYNEQKDREEEISEFLDSINYYVLDELGIKMPEVRDKMPECFTVYTDEMEGRIDPHFYKPEFRELNEKLTKLQHGKLGDIVDFSSETWNQNDFFDREFPYIEISKINISLGKIQNITYYEKKDAPSRAKMIVRENDIIVSTTRPHRGAIALIDKEKDGFIASTGFAVLRELKIDMDKKYLLFMLRTQLSLKQMLQKSSGGNYPAIAAPKLKNLKIPLPSLSIQNKIADEVKKRMKDAEILQKEATEELEKAKQEVEKIILG